LIARATELCLKTSMAISEMRRLSRAEALDLALSACRGAGANEAAAASLAAATVSAEAHGKAAVGFAHLLDYLTSLTEGRIDGAAEPVLSFPAAALVQVDARGGVAQLGFDLAFDELCARANRYGVAVFAQRNSYTAGELGYYARRLAEADLLGLAMSNGPPLMAAPGVGKAVYCTNPIAFAAPGEGRAALLIDQASSATAFVKIREAAERGEALPEGWAIDADGAPTNDPIRALTGALLPFGGARGANIALMIEVMAAGLTGANWSLDAPDFSRGNRSPGAGLLVIAVAPRLLDAGFATRLDAHLQTLEHLGVHVPGRTEAQAKTDDILVPASLVERVAAFGERHRPSWPG
jgi:(2R)-3-sulfolactate dehydrogenase (NADP+)